MDHELLIELTNHNGYRDAVYNIGRLERCINSLIKCQPFVKSIAHLILIDQASEDGSRDYIRSLPFGKKFYLEYATDFSYYDAKIFEYIRNSGVKWWCHIENDSVFFNTADFFDQAIDVLSSNHDVQFVHLRQIGPLDEILQQNVMFDVLASSQLKHTPAGTGYWQFDKRKPFSPWAIYTNHGWIARTATILNLFEEIMLYDKDPLELQLSILSKSKEYASAKLLSDAFWHWSKSGWWAAPEESLYALESLPEKVKYVSSYVLREYFYGVSPHHTWISKGDFSHKWLKLRELFLIYGLKKVYSYLGLI